MSINDPISNSLYRNPTDHRGVVRLRYAPDYGHGFLGLFNALFEGKIEEVIRDPGPPFIYEKDIPAIVKTLYSFLYFSNLRSRIPKKYLRYVKDFVPPETYSKDNLF